MCLNLLRRAYFLSRKKYLISKLTLSRKPVIIDQGWIKLELTDRDDEQMIQYILKGRYWHKCDENVFRRFLKTGDVVIDIGANVGFVTLELALIVGSKGKVVAIEPSKRTFAQLLRTLQLNEAVSVVPINLACSSFKGEGDLYSIGPSSGLKTMRKPNNSAVNSKEPILVDTLDDILGRLELGRADFIKIDVEGHEAEVLKGAIHTLSAFRPIVYFEVSTTYGQQAYEAWALLNSLGYSLDITREDLGKILNVRNVLALPRDV